VNKKRFCFYVDCRSWQLGAGHGLAEQLQRGYPGTPIFVTAVIGHDKAGGDW
jgi:hypothetical protein